jgi:hypothetical protein
MLGLLKNKRLAMFVLLGAIILLGISYLFVVGPPDEAPPLDSLINGGG